MASTRYLPILIALLPAVTIHTTYLVSAWQGFVPWCNPYWDSCTSISATGRHGISFYLFKAVMLPAAFVLMKYWYEGANRLHAFGESGRDIFYIGCIGAVFLIVYTVALGIQGDVYQLQRRIGIIIFFGFTFLAQFLFTYKTGRTGVADPTHQGQLIIGAIVIATGIMTLVLDAVMETYDDYEDAVEWIIALLLQIWFLLSYWSWKALDLATTQLRRPPVFSIPEREKRH